MSFVSYKTSEGIISLYFYSYFKVHLRYVVGCAEDFCSRNKLRGKKRKIWKYIFNTLSLALFTVHVKLSDSSFAFVCLFTITNEFEIKK
jgi:hypothetical protein